MAFSTWSQSTNKVLELHGQLQITSSVNFNNPITNLTRIQSQTRAFIDLCDRKLNRKRYNRDNTREFQITTQVGSPTIPSTYTYALDMSVRMEYLRYYSFFNITPQTLSGGVTSTVVAQPLYNIPYREFRLIYPDFTSITLGPPQNWIIMPKTLVAGGVGIQQDYVMFYPIPDKIYTIVYQSGLKAVPLALDTDSILFDQDNEDVLWDWAGAYLEEALGEGRGQMAAAYAEKAVSEYLFRMSGPEEEKRAIRTGMSIYGPLRGRRVAPYSDTPNSL